MRYRPGWMEWEMTDSKLPGLSALNDATLETLSEEVVIGLMGVSIMNP